jgi:hypothetical protein
VRNAQVNLADLDRELKEFHERRNQVAEDGGERQQQQDHPQREEHPDDGHRRRDEQNGLCHDPADTRRIGQC